jgi:hypothetical protein
MLEKQRRVQLADAFNIREGVSENEVAHYKFLIQSEFEYLRKMGALAYEKHAPDINSWLRSSQKIPVRHCTIEENSEDELKQAYFGKKVNFRQVILKVKDAVPHYKFYFIRITDNTGKKHVQFLDKTGQTFQNRWFNVPKVHTLGLAISFYDLYYHLKYPFKIELFGTNKSV